MKFDTPETLLKVENDLHFDITREEIQSTPVFVTLNVPGQPGTMTENEFESAMLGARPCMTCESWTSFPGADFS